MSDYGYTYKLLALNQDGNESYAQEFSAEVIKQMKDMTFGDRRRVLFVLNMMMENLELDEWIKDIDNAIQDVELDQIQDLKRKKTLLSIRNFVVENRRISRLQARTVNKVW